MREKEYNIVIDKVKQTVSVKSFYNSISEYIDMFAKYNCGIIDIKVLEPSLEDALVSIIGDKK